MGVFDIRLQIIINGIKHLANFEHTTQRLHLSDQCVQHLILALITFKIIRSVCLGAAIGFTVTHIIECIITIQLCRTLFQIDICPIHTVGIAHIRTDVNIHSAKLIHNITEALEIEHGGIIDIDVQIFAHHRLHFILGEYAGGFLLGLEAGVEGVDLGLLITAKLYIGITGQRNNRRGFRLRVQRSHHNNIRQIGGMLRTVIGSQQQHGQRLRRSKLSAVYCLIGTKAALLEFIVQISGVSQSGKHGDQHQHQQHSGQPGKKAALFNFFLLRFGLRGSTVLLSSASLWSV
ncbi:hypothetical protein D3C80_1078920 [compost metagenome]